MKIAIYPGSFDPFTNGHLDILRRASVIFDVVHLAVGVNARKASFFSLEERLAMLEEIASQFDNVQVGSFEALTVEYAASIGAGAIIRGLRALNDFEYEFQIALMNENLDPSIETVFLMARKENTFISSSLIKELASYGRDVGPYVPAIVKRYLGEKFSREEGK